MLDNLDPDKANKQLTDKLNDTYSLLSAFVNFRYDLLIYKLVKRGIVSMADMARETNTSIPTIRRIIEKFDEQGYYGKIFG